MLVADDDEDLRVLLELWFARRGHTVVAARDGLEAVSLFERCRVDLAIVDMHMPGLDGHAVLTRIRMAGSGPSRSDIPVVLMSGSKVDVPDGLGAGAGATIVRPKPAPLVTLSETCERLLLEYPVAS